VEAAANMVVAVGLVVLPMVLVYKALFASYGPDVNDLFLQLV
jgi:hypothetical protein